MMSVRTVVGAALALAWAGSLAGQERPPEVDPRARVVAHDSAAFTALPAYRSQYEVQAQLDIYGAKHLNPTQRPLLELGRDLYERGPFRPAPTLLGGHNLLIPQLLVYGDYRLGAATNSAGSDVTSAAHRFNVDVDLKLTATERVHALFRPFDGDGQFTRYVFEGDSTGFASVLDGTPDALFFEGDLGAIAGSFGGGVMPFDLPIAAGRMPLIFHNGVWIEDVLDGAAFTIPARNSASLDWSNFDLTFFGAMAGVSNPVDATADAQAVGFNAFVEAYRGYMELGYAFVRSSDSARVGMHSVAASFTKRAGRKFSSSIRYLGSFGQGGANAPESGHLLLLETSLITSRPSSVVPYINLFASLGTPAPAARDAGSGSVLKNTGINFESDGLTGFPTLGGSVTDRVGGALGVNLLGGRLNRQIVLEAAATYPVKKDATTPPAQLGFGLRGQKPLTNALILRIDGMIGLAEGGERIHGARLELRHKF